MPATADLWRRYGHERVYVTAGDGTKLGYLDLKTEEARNVPPGRMEEFQAAIVAWRRSSSSPGSPRAGQPRRPPDQPRRTSQTGQWVDLAANQPGQSAAEVAAAYRQARPVRSLFDRLLGRHSDERAWRVGAQGEVKTARRLRVLTDPGPFDRRVTGVWRVLHSIPIGHRGRDIDHLVIGPPGVFAINSKNHEGLVTATSTAITVGRRPTRYAEIARDEAARASLLLTAVAARQVPVTPVISVVGAPTVVRGRPRDVVVLPVDKLTDWLLTQPVRYHDEAIEELFALARRSSAW
jgi:hypothetical protein